MAKGQTRERLGAWVQASRPLAQANIALPLLFGQALAFAACDTFAWPAFFAALLFGVALQLYIVFANDAADWASDVSNATYNRFSGGSRVVPEGKLTPHELLGGAAAALVLLMFVAIGAWRWLDRPWLGAIAVLSALLLWAYSFRPIRLSYRGYGEWLQAIGVGALLPTAGYYLQCASFARFPWQSLVPSLLLAWAGNLTTALPDKPSDEATGKHTYPVRRGERAARSHSLYGIVGAALATPLVAPNASWAVVATVTALPLGVLAFNLGGIPTADARQRELCTRFVTLNGAAIMLVLLGWSLALAWQR